MIIRNFLHKGLRRFYHRGEERALPPNYVDKIRNMLGFLESMDNPAELHSLPSWGAHILAGSRKGTWSLSVTRNWRLTFLVDEGEREIREVNLEDYH